MTAWTNQRRETQAARANEANLPAQGRAAKQARRARRFIHEALTRSLDSIGITYEDPNNPTTATR